MLVRRTLARENRGPAITRPTNFKPDHESLDMISWKVLCQIHAEGKLELRGPRVRKRASIPVWILSSIRVPSEKNENYRKRMACWDRHPHHLVKGCMTGGAWRSEIVIHSWRKDAVSIADRGYMSSASPQQTFPTFCLLSNPCLLLKDSRKHHVGIIGETWRCSGRFTS